MKKELLLILAFGFSTILLGQTYHPNTPNLPTVAESLTHIGDNVTLVVTGNATWFLNVYSTDETDITPPGNNVWETVFGQSSADQKGRYLFGGGDLLSTAQTMQLPDKFMINNAYPNPFNPSTTIEYAIPDAATHGKVSIQIYDITSRLVSKLVDGQKAAGWHSVVWNDKDVFGKHAPAGMYLVRVSAGVEVKLTKVMLVR